MSTRSLIGYKDKDSNTYIAAYCHWDGYLSGVGKTLIEYYDNEESARALANLISFSDLESKLEYTKEMVHDDIDRDEPYRIKISDIIDEAKRFGAACVYIFMDGGWYYLSVDRQDTEPEFIRISKYGPQKTKYREHSFESNGTKVKVCTHSKAHSGIYVSLRGNYGAEYSEEVRLSEDQAKDLITKLNQALQFINDPLQK